MQEIMMADKLFGLKGRLMIGFFTILWLFFSYGYMRITHWVDRKFVPGEDLGFGRGLYVVNWDTVPDLYMAWLSFLERMGVVVANNHCCNFDQWSDCLCFRGFPLIGYFAYVYTPLVISLVALYFVIWVATGKIR